MGNAIPMGNDISMGNDIPMDGDISMGNDMPLGNDIVNQSISSMGMIQLSSDYLKQHKRIQYILENTGECLLLKQPQGIYQASLCARSYFIRTNVM